MAKAKALSPELEQRLRQLGAGISRVATEGASSAVVAQMATDLTSIVNLLQGGLGDRPWTEGPCHGYVMSPGSSTMRLSCHGECADDPLGERCRERSVFDEKTNLTRWFCSCDDSEPEGCHLVWIRNEETGSTEIKCEGPCKNQNEGCTVKHFKDKFFDPPWHYYWCECKAHKGKLY